MMSRILTFVLAVLAGVLVCPWTAVAQSPLGTPALVVKDLADPGVPPALSAGELVPPPPPNVEPVIEPTYVEDADGDLIADDLAMEVDSARAAQLGAKTAQSIQSAEAVLSETVEVELIFSEPIEQWQIDGFVALGGEITHIYQTVSYGWNGRIPLNQVDALPAQLGETLVLVEQKQIGQFSMRLATQTARVRPVWASGFAGSASGYDGSADISIAIMDTGLDGTHTDLAGRQAYWHDYSGQGHLSPIDIGQHGTHVAGIALGSGASLGTGTVLNFTQGGDFTDVASGYTHINRFEMPSATSNWTLYGVWAGTSPANLYFRRAEAGSTSVTNINGGSLNSGQGYTLSTYSFLNTRDYIPMLVSNGGMQNYVTLNTLSNFPAVGDGFNTLRGVAPGCKWVGAKVGDESVYVSNLVVATALDDMVTQRATYNIKVLNMSLGFGIETTIRQKVNTAANYGIVPVSAAGNSGLSSTATAREIGDPGRASMGLTVGASNDVNRLTDYTSHGFSSPGTGEDYKPDVIAPGGSNYYSDILSVDSNSSDAPNEEGTAWYEDFESHEYANMHGTSMASPFVAGCVALVIDALQSTGNLTGSTWDFNSSNDVRLVKMLLCATATETNANRESGSYNPTLQRASNGPSYPAGKDMYEGYGMLNVDAAIEGGTVSYTLGSTASSNFDGTVTGRRAWARRVSLTSGSAFQVTLTVPAGGDYDLYLYSFSPSSCGTPVILASSTNAGLGVAESINYTPTFTGPALLVVKRVSGSGSFTLADLMAPTFSSIAASPSLAKQGTAVTLTFTASETLSGNPTVTVNAHAAAYSSKSGNNYTYGYTVQASDSDGDATIQINGNDVAGNAGAAANTTALDIDKTAPNAPSVTGVSPTNDSTPAWSWTSGGGGNGAFRYSLDGSGWTETTASTFTPAAPLSGGSHRLTVQERDGAGNWSASGFFDIVVDITPPTVSVTSSEGSPTIANPIPFDIDFSETVPDFGQGGIAVANGSVSTFNGSGTHYDVAITPAGQGEVTVTVAAGAAHDAAGNPNAGPASHAVTYAIPVSFPDPVLRAAVLSAIGKTSEPIFDSDLAGLTSLEVVGGSTAGAKVSDLTGLEHCVALQHLGLSRNLITDLGPISGLTSLNYLNLATNSLAGDDLAALTALTNLTYLNVSLNQVTSVSGLLGMTELRYLLLDYNRVGDISPLQDMTQLQELWLRGNLVVSIAAVSGMSQLRVLHMSTNGVTDARPLAGCTQLAFLSLSANALTNVAALEGLTQLSNVYLYGNSVSDLLPLVNNAGLGTGDTLNVANNPLSLLSGNTHIPALQARGVNVVYTGAFPPNAPVLSGPSTSSDGKPTWTWVSGGGGGTGAYRYQLDGEAGVWTTIAGTSFTPSTALTLGVHTLYVQERNAAGLWSASGSKAVEVLTVPELLVNGSFELGVDPGAALKLAAGSTGLSGWTVGGAGVYYVGSYYQAGQGARCIKLTLQKPGWIAQTVATTPGQTYRVAFLMAGDPFPYLTPAEKIKTLEVSASVGATVVGSQQFTFDTTGKNVRNMGWDARSWTFTATSTATVLRIASVSPGPYGPCVDNVVVTAD